MTRQANGGNPIYHHRLYCSPPDCLFYQCGHPHCRSRRLPCTWKERYRRNRRGLQIAKSPSQCAVGQHVIRLGAFGIRAKLHLTGTMAGQIVMEGFLDIRLKPWVRRLLTRSLAIIPAVLCVIFYGESALGGLLILSQVILSLQLGFAVIPLVWFTSDPTKMGKFANTTVIKILAWGCAGIILTLNIKYVINFLK